eukprot:scaffold576_cov180-Skeletonema_dohrnii-CCMP3373.AAC.7
MDNNYSPRDTASSASGHNNFVNNHTLKSPDGVVSTDNFKSFKNPDNTNDVNESEDSPPQIKRRKDSSVFEDAEPSVFDNAAEPRQRLVWNPYTQEYDPLATPAASIPPMGVPRTTSLPKKPTDPVINSAKISCGSCHQFRQEIS